MSFKIIATDGTSTANTSFKVTVSTQSKAWPCLNIFIVENEISFDITQPPILYASDVKDYVMDDFDMQTKNTLDATWD